ncbi:adenosylcobinamide-GDP ribazoletransferase [Micromonospora sp. CPCC 206061]|uniref:adenosylcobinamide-GDP ribazoletransferase n=1 Tax=Micromonospora sp. CPCC 206061 TaxID=3122410 RepID=UPI002FF296C2
MRDGARLALTTFTVVPLRPGRVDRAAAGVAMAMAPAVGGALGVALAAVLFGLGAAGAPPLVAGGVTLATGALLTRGLHLDGLADTADGLGSYRSGDAALQIMKKPDVGPFGVAALVLVLLIQAAALAGLAGHGWLPVFATVVAATATARLAATWACRRGVPPARPDGLGALVAGTVGPLTLAVATAAVAVVAIPAVPGRPWQGPVAVLASLAAAVLLVRHAVRRFGGVTGDVLGAAVELAATVAYVALAFR